MARPKSIGTDLILVLVGLILLVLAIRGNASQILASALSWLFGQKTNTVADTLATSKAGNSATGTGSGNTKQTTTQTATNKPSYSLSKTLPKGQTKAQTRTDGVVVGNGTNGVPKGWYGIPRPNIGAAGESGALPNWLNGLFGSSGALAGVEGG